MNQHTGNLKENLKNFSRNVMNVPSPDQDATIDEQNQHEVIYTKVETTDKNPTRVNMLENDELADGGTGPEQDHNWGTNYYIGLVIKNLVVILGVLAILCGILTIFSFHFKCLVAGILLSATGLVIIAFEAPLLLSSLKFIDPVREFSQGRQPYEKIIIYTVPPVIALLICFTFMTLFGSLCVFGVSTLYVFAYII